MKIGIDIDDTICDTRAMTLEFLKKHDPTLHIPVHEDLTDKRTHDFLVTHLEEIQDAAELFPGVKEAFDEFKKMNFEIIIITARGGELDYKFEEVTESYFKKHNLPYDKIYYGNMAKGDAALKEGISYFIDDRVYNLDDVSQHGVDCIHIVNDINTKSPYKTFDKWDDIVSYIKSKEA